MLLQTRLLAALVGLALAANLAASDAATPIDPDGIKGTLVAVGGGNLPESIRKLVFEKAGGDKGRLIVIPTASDAAENQTPENLRKPWAEMGFASVEILHTRSRDTANSPEFIQPLQEATGVWIDGGDQSRIADAYAGTAVERELIALRDRGGVIAGTSAGAAIQSRVMIARGNPDPEIATGLPLFPNAIIDQHFTQRKREPRSRRAVERHRTQVGVGVDEATAAVLEGRELRVVGEGAVTISLAETQHRAAMAKSFRSGSVLDWVALQRAARDRAVENDWPHEPISEPSVPSGSLVIVGGGGMPKGLTEKFIELAGGPDALIVILPTAVPPDPRRKPEDEARFFTRAGATNVKVLPQRHHEVPDDTEFHKTLAQAKGLWFGGGRQWRFVDCYEGTTAVQAFHDVLKRGGVIGGSSAGATIQGEYLCRASPLGNLQMMAEGYERGFAVLPGTAIDQHFAQRNRFDDMTRLMAVHPGFLGIGLDESTAIIVRGTEAEVVGNGQVHFYNRRVPRVAGEKDHTSVSAGGKYDLKERVQR